MLRLVLIFFALSLPGIACGAGESALMPGQVIAGHAKLEAECTNCHVRFHKEAQSGLCADCHKDIKADLESHKGFHGKMEQQACNTCHTEHKGRNAKIVILDKAKFDHTKTDFPLLGAHQDKQKVKCSDCHKEKKKYREAPITCNGCHQKDDKHKGSLGPDCKSCHIERSWKEAKFDHSLEKTHFLLKDKHQDVKCSKCHLTQGTYKNAPLECVGCHKKDDKHKGRYGKKCETCHVERGWKVLTFEHDIETKFKLLGSHRTVKCIACHVRPLFTKPSLTMTCIGCHKKDDVHKGGLGTQCQTCHNEVKWKKSKFDHDRDTKFSLKGKHITTKCDACHTPALKASGAKLPMDCYSCHQKKDVHKGTLGKRCESCHNEKDWKDAIFDHGRARFPLVGLHIKVECKKCHTTEVFRNTPSDCYSCHKKDDDKIHKLRLGRDCAVCHNPRSWKVWDFDHDTRTHFKLDGAHKTVTCYACHKLPMLGHITLAKTCDGCHDNQDVHQGEFGQQCDRCHFTSKWKNLRPGIKGQRY